jgi:hypothetical protein
LVHAYGIDEAGHADAVRRYVKRVISVPRTGADCFSTRFASVHVSDGAGVEYFAQTRVAPSPNESFVFVYDGNFQSTSNVRAVRFFGKEVMPLILQQHPSAEFEIFG